MASKSKQSEETGRTVGRASGLGLGEFISQMFTENFKTKKDDETLASVLNKEFPGLNADQTLVRRKRSRWNRLVSDKFLPKFVGGIALEKGRRVVKDETEKANASKKTVVKKAVVKTAVKKVAKKVVAKKN